MIETLTDPTSTSERCTAAHRAARRSFSSNLRALSVTQRALLDDNFSLPANVEWVYSRDGSLTCLDAEFKWWAGCSLPTRAAQFMLKKADLDGTVLCFLYPRHAAQIRLTLDRAHPAQAVLVLIPDGLTLPMILACDDFSKEIAAHRLFFATGEQWEQQLNDLLESRPGLPTPTQFIRPILADSSPADAMIAPAQKIFADHSNLRGAAAKSLRDNWRRKSVRRVCVIAPSLFRLWDNAGLALSRAMDASLGEVTVEFFNPDDPASASSAALAMAASSCDAVVAPNTGRADLPDLLPDEMPWATWVTTPRIPPAETAGPNDTLLLADPAWKALAVQRGWHQESLFFAQWPPCENGIFQARKNVLSGTFESPDGSALAIIFDTQPLDPPQRVIDYSSHRLLWESIEHELLDDPFAMETSADSYLTRRMQRANIDDNGFDRIAFLDGVILHGWQQGLARLLNREKLPVSLYGKGWERIKEFSRHAHGPVTSHEELARAISSSAALIHAWPSPHEHAIDAVGKPVIRPGKHRSTFIRDAQLALAGRLQIPHDRQNFLTAETVFRALSRKVP